MVFVIFLYLYIQEGRLGYTSMQKIAILWVFHATIVKYEKTGKLFKHSPNFLECALKTIRTTFDIEIPRNTIKKWNAATLINYQPNQYKNRPKKNPSPTLLEIVDITSVVTNEDKSG